MAKMNSERNGKWTRFVPPNFQPLVDRAIEEGLDIHFAWVIKQEGLYIKPSAYKSSGPYPYLVTPDDVTAQLSEAKFYQGQPQVHRQEVFLLIQMPGINKPRFWELFDRDAYCPYLKEIFVLRYANRLPTDTQSWARVTGSDAFGPTIISGVFDQATRFENESWAAKLADAWAERYQLKIPSDHPLRPIPVSVILAKVK